MLRKGPLEKEILSMMMTTECADSTGMNRTENTVKYREHILPSATDTNILMRNDHHNLFVVSGTYTLLNRKKGVAALLYRRHHTLILGLLAPIHTSSTNAE